MYSIVGHCPRCGAPIYAQSPWWAISPPPSIHSCNCFGTYSTSTANTNPYTINISVNGVNGKQNIDELLKEIEKAIRKKLNERENIE